MSFKLSDKKDLAFQDYLNVWRTGAYADPDNNQVFAVEMEDALAHPNSTEYFPVTVETLVREAIEPVLIGTNLLQRINYKTGLQISFPSIGAMTADDVNEAGEYPEYTLNFGPGAQIITIGKSGIAIKYTDEMKRYSQYDVLGMYIRAMGRALARHKESKIFAMLSKSGVVTHDNKTPSSSVFGVTTGYAAAGTANGTLNLDNLYEAYGQVLMNGFTPDTLLVHPLTYTMFLTDPVLRAFAINHGAGTWFNGWNGNGQTEYPWPRGVMGGMGPGPKKESSSSNPVDLVPMGATMKLPSYLGLPLRIMVSPFIPYNHSTKLTDLYLVDSNNIGAYIVDEEATMEDIPDRLRDLTKIKIRERYAIHPFNEGNAIAVMKNILVAPNQLQPVVTPTLSNFTPISNRNSAVV